MPLLTPTWFDYDDINRDPTAQVPPYNLLASVPRELKGTVMLLECSDPAKILFTLHEDHNPDFPPDRAYEMVMTHSEGAYIARSILILKLIEHGYDGEEVWPIMYEMVISDETRGLLEWTVWHLLSVTGDESDEEVKKGPGFPKWLRFGSQLTLTIVRMYWQKWLDALTTDSKVCDEFREQAINAHKDGIKATTRGRVSCAPFWSYGAPLVKAHHRYYWTKFLVKNTKSALKHVNPTFVFTRSGTNFNVNPDYDPVLGFHLGLGLCEQALAPEKDTKMADHYSLDLAAKIEFTNWCKVAHGYFKDDCLIFHFLADDPMEVCVAYLQNQVPPPDRKIGFVEGDIRATCISKVFSPMMSSFEAIDTGNLIDSVGAYGLILATRGLLKPAFGGCSIATSDLSSCLYTETWMGGGTDGANQYNTLFEMFGIDPAIFFTLFRIAPVETQCQQSSLYPHGDSIEAKNPHDKTKIRYTRIAWKRIESHYPDGFPKTKDAFNLPKFVFSAEVKDVLEILFRINRFLFEIEQPVFDGDSTEPPAVSRQYTSTRMVLTYVLDALRHLTFHLGRANWDLTIESLIEVIGVSGKSKNLSHFFLPEMVIYNDAYEVQKRAILSRNPTEERFIVGKCVKGAKGQLLPPVLCLTLTIPVDVQIGCMRLLREHGNGKIPHIRLVITDAHGISNNYYETIKLQFGDLRPPESVQKAGITIQNGPPWFESNHQRWGAQPALISIACLTYPLLIEGCKVSAHFVLLPKDAKYVADKFGSNLKFMEELILNEKAVRLSTVYPTPLPSTLYERVIVNPAQMLLKFSSSQSKPQYAKEITPEESSRLKQEEESQMLESIMKAEINNGTSPDDPDWVDRILAIKAQKEQEVQKTHWLDEIINKYERFWTDHKSILFNIGVVGDTRKNIEKSSNYDRNDGQTVILQNSFLNNDGDFDVYGIDTAFQARTLNLLQFKADPVLRFISISCKTFLQPGNWKPRWIGSLGKSVIKVQSLSATSAQFTFGRHAVNIPFAFLVQDVIYGMVFEGDGVIAVAALPIASQMANWPAYQQFPIGFRTDSRDLILPVHWSMHRVNLDKASTILTHQTKFDPQDFQWIPDICGPKSFEREEAKENQDVYAKYKASERVGETIREILTKYVSFGEEGPRHVFQIALPIHGVSYILIAITAIKHDLNALGIVADCIFVPLPFGSAAKDAFEALPPDSQEFGRLHAIDVGLTELDAWNQLSASLTERCRTYKHTKKCEYLEHWAVPLKPHLIAGREYSKKHPRQLLCSCGVGVWPEGYYTVSGQLADIIRKYGTRAALGPIYTTKLELGIEGGDVDGWHKGIPRAIKVVGTDKAQELTEKGAKVERGKQKYFEMVDRIWKEKTAGENGEEKQQEDKADVEQPKKEDDAIKSDTATSLVPKRKLDLQSIIRKEDANLCDNCYVKESELVKLTPCQNCGARFYCSDECRDADWERQHSIQCDYLGSFWKGLMGGSESPKDEDSNDPATNPNGSSNQKPKDSSNQTPKEESSSQEQNGSSYQHPDDSSGQKESGDEGAILYHPENEPWVDAQWVFRHGRMVRISYIPFALTKEVALLDTLFHRMRCFDQALIVPGGAVMLDGPYLDSLVPQEQNKLFAKAAEILQTDRLCLVPGKLADIPPDLRDTKEPEHEDWEVLDYRQGLKDDPWSFVKHKPVHYIRTLISQIYDPLNTGSWSDGGLSEDKTDETDTESDPERSKQITLFKEKILKIKHQIDRFIKQVKTLEVMDAKRRKFIQLVDLLCSVATMGEVVSYATGLLAHVESAIDVFEAAVLESNGKEYQVSHEPYWRLLDLRDLLKAHEEEMLVEQRIDNGWEAEKATEDHGISGWGNPESLWAQVQAMMPKRYELQIQRSTKTASPSQPEQLVILPLMKTAKSNGVSTSESPLFQTQEIKTCCRCSKEDRWPVKLHPCTGCGNRLYCSDFCEEEDRQFGHEHSCKVMQTVREDLDKCYKDLADHDKKYINDKRELEEKAKLLFTTGLGGDIAKKEEDILLNNTIKLTEKVSAYKSGYHAPQTSKQAIEDFKTIGLFLADVESQTAAVKAGYQQAESPSLEYIRGLGSGVTALQTAFADLDKLMEETKGRLSRLENRAANGAPVPANGVLSNKQKPQSSTKRQRLDETLDGFNEIKQEPQRWETDAASSSTNTHFASQRFREGEWVSQGGRMVKLVGIANCTAGQLERISEVFQEFPLFNTATAHSEHETTFDGPTFPSPEVKEELLIKAMYIMKKEEIDADGGVVQVLREKKRSLRGQARKTPAGRKGSNKRTIAKAPKFTMQAKTMMITEVEEQEDAKPPSPSKQIAAKTLMSMKDAITDHVDPVDDGISAVGSGESTVNELTEATITTGSQLVAKDGREDSPNTEEQVAKALEQDLLMTVEEMVAESLDEHGGDPREVTLKSKHPNPAKALSQLDILIKRCEANVTRGDFSLPEDIYQSMLELRGRLELQVEERMMDHGSKDILEASTASGIDEGSPIPPSLYHSDGSKEDEFEEDAEPLMITGPLGLEGLTIAGDNPSASTFTKSKIVPGSTYSHEEIYPDGTGGVPMSKDSKPSLTQSFSVEPATVLEEPHLAAVEENSISVISETEHEATPTKYFPRNSKNARLTRRLQEEDSASETSTSSEEILGVSAAEDLEIRTSAVDSYEAHRLMTIEETGAVEGQNAPYPPPMMAVEVAKFATNDAALQQARSARSRTVTERSSPGKKWPLPNIQKDNGRSLRGWRGLRDDDHEDSSWPPPPPDDLEQDKSDSEESKASGPGSDGSGSDSDSSSEGGNDKKKDKKKRKKKKRQGKHKKGKKVPQAGGTKKEDDRNSSVDSDEEDEKVNGTKGRKDRKRPSTMNKTGNAIRKKVSGLWGSLKGR